MKSNRLLSLPKYLFEELASRHAQAVSSGRDVVNLSIGDPDLDPPESLKRRLVAALEKSSNHCYPPQRGTAVLKRAVGDFLYRHHGVKPRDNEILILVGSKEGIGHLPLAVCNHGDGVLVPDPGYPVYRASAILAGCDPVAVSLERNGGFLPDFGALSADQLREARLCFINYPNNPTSVAASSSSLLEILEMMEERDIILANDAAYADIFFDERPAVLSSLSGALDARSIEFFSFSKMLSITGWRVGFAVGNRRVIDALAGVKANIDSGVFCAIQEAVAETLNSDVDAYAGFVREQFRERRDKALDIVKRMGLGCVYPEATFYLWVNVPGSWKSMDFALMLLEKADVLVTPGTGFGSSGEGYFRMALTCSLARLEEAGERMIKAVRAFDV